MEIKEKHKLFIQDKNGREIHSQDKIKMGDFQGTVSYDKDSCRFIIKWDDGSSRPLTAHFANQIEVISE